MGYENMNTSVRAKDIASVSYDPISRIAHWLTFILVAAEFTVGWWMPEIEWGTRPVGLIGVHLALGGSILVVVALRVIWRFTHAAPPPPQDVPAWQQRLAGVTHFVLYALLFIMPLTGWISASAREWTVKAFWLIPLPAIVPPHTGFAFQLGDLHAGVLCWVLLGVIGLHAVAALYHHFIKHDSVLQRMLPR